MGIPNNLSLLKQLCLFAIGLLFSLQLRAQTLYGITDAGQLYRIDVANCTETFVTNVNMANLSDITFHPNGQLYRLSLNGMLVRIDILTGITTNVHSFPLDSDPNNAQLYNALTVSLDGLFYATGDLGELYSYDLSSGNEYFLGNINLPSAGDLTSYGGELYLSIGYPAGIIQLDLLNLANSSFTVNISQELQLFGLTSVVDDCAGQVTYTLSYTLDPELLVVNWNTASTTTICDLNNFYWGSASLTEFFPPPVLVPLTIQNIDPIQPICREENGSITITANGGTGTFVYSIDGTNFQANNTFTNLSHGLYTVTVMDETSCTVTQEVDLSLAPPPEILNIETIDIFCSNTTGGFTITAFSTIEPLAYSIDGINYQSDNSFEDLSEGIYTIIVLDGNNCDTSQDFELTSAPLPKITDLLSEDTSCGENNGTIMVDATGGSGQIFYSIDGINYQPSNTFENLVPEEYTIYILDANVCSDTTEVTIAGSRILAIISSESTPSDCGENNGSIAVELQADFTDLQIIVNNKSYPSVNDINDLSCGEYTLTISDQFGCSVEGTASIAQNECPIYIPNVFSPNDDSINDRFKIYPHPAFKGLFQNFKVFNRWGGLVYEIENFNPQDLSWNGIFKGQASEAGVYTYFLEFTTENGGDNLLKGDFTLVK